MREPSSRPSAGSRLLTVPLLSVVVLLVLAVSGLTGARATATPSGAGPVLVGNQISDGRPSGERCKGRLGPELQRYVTLHPPRQPEEVDARGQTIYTFVNSAWKDDGSAVFKLSADDCRLHLYRIIGAIILRFERGGAPTSRQCPTARPPVEDRRMLIVYCSG